MEELTITAIYLNISFQHGKKLCPLLIPSPVISRF